MIAAFLQRLHRALTHAHIPYMIIGGQAVLYYGSPRLTQDVDVMLGLDTDACERVLRVCKTSQLTPLVKQPVRFAQETHVLPVIHQASGIRVDFIFSNTSYERQAIRRARHVRMGKGSIRMAAVEDLVVQKLIAGRPVDVEDVRVILARRRKPINTAYVRRWLKAFEATGEVRTHPLMTFKHLRGELRDARIAKRRLHNPHDRLISRITLTKRKR